MKKLLQLGFLPRSVDFALLLLRVWIGLTMAINHGWGKLAHFSAMKGGLPNPLGVGGTANMCLAVLAEVVCPVLLVFGFAARLAALILAIEMGIAFIMVHHLAFSGAHSGELAFLYLGGALTIFFAGGGKFSADGA